MLINKPLYTNNQIGLCSLYALCNLFHFEEDGCNEALERFSERGELGYTLAECDFIAKTILGTGKALNICYYDPMFMDESTFDKIKKISGIEIIEKELNGHEVIKGLYMPFLINIISNNDEYHSIAAYYEFDTEMFIFMDSSTSQIWAEHWSQFIKRERCYGVSMFIELTESENGKYNFVPMFFEREQLKIFAK